MSTMTDIEQRADDYAAARSALADLVANHRAQVEAVTRRALPAIRQAVARANDLGAQLKADIEAAPELFEKPRTRTFSGIKVGFQKQKGKTEIPDEEKTIALIRKLLPEDQAELLINVKECVYKPGVADLTAADLKRLAITVTADSDAVVIKATDSELDKLVAALLKDVEAMEQQAA